MTDIDEIEPPRPRRGVLALWFLALITWHRIRRDVLLQYWEMFIGYYRIHSREDHWLHVNAATYFLDQARRRLDRATAHQRRIDALAPSYARATGAPAPEPPADDLGSQ